MGIRKKTDNQLIEYIEGKKAIMKKIEGRATVDGE